MVNREINRVKLLMSFVDYIQKTHAVLFPCSLRFPHAVVASLWDELALPLPGW